MPKPSSHPTPDSSQTPSPKEAARISRRDFGRQAAVAAALSLSPAQLLAATSSTGSPSPAAAKSGAPVSSDLTPEQTKEVEAKLANIIRKYGDRLTDSQRDHLRRILAHNEKMLASVRSFALQNGDSPASVLKISFVEERELPKKHVAAVFENPRSVAESEKAEG